jgi:hypothetical protein
VNNARAGLVVLLLGAPEVLEGAEGSQDGTTDPDGVLTLKRSDDLDLDRVSEKISIHACVRRKVNEPSCWKEREQGAPSAYDRRYQRT